ncbi:MAG: MFS transporter [Chitinophagales bacterium]
MSNKPRLSTLDIFNMSFGFLGIQIGFGLQGTNMSRIFQTLGASESQIPGLWLAAPLTGLLVQPIIGYYSDRTWSKWGRRKPYFFVGAVLSCVALMFMPHVGALWMAAGMLCLLDASINVSMEPFRALVADKLPDEQQTQGFAMQSILIGLGALLASLSPLLFKAMGVANTAPEHVIPDNVKYSFYLGAFCFMAAILYTNLTTPEYPPADMAAFEEERRNGKGIWNALKEIFAAIGNMPLHMKQIAVVQLFTWFALFAMWSNATPAITAHIFHADDPTTKAYNDGADFINGCWAVFNVLTTLAGFILPAFARRIGKRSTHRMALILGGMGLLSIYFIENPNMLYVSFALIGIAWSSILCMPFSIIAAAIPAKKMGVYMGLFNMFICIPQIIASLGGLNFLSHHFIGPNAIHGIVLAGVLMMSAGLATLIISPSEAITKASN